MLSLGMALADYQRGLLSADSPFDRWYFDGVKNALNESAQRGFDIFIVADCSSCHPFDQSFALFSDDNFYDIGIGYKASILDSSPAASAPIQVQLAPGVFVTTESLPTRAFNDLGRYEATGRSQDRWKYLTPGLRNIAITEPYMHDGSMASLEEVIQFYDDGGFPHAGQDKRIRPLHLTIQQKLDLLAFLESLTGSNVRALARDARLAPIGER